VLGPPLGGDVLGLEPERREPVADVAGAVLIVVPRRVDGGNANHADGEVDEFVGGPFHFMQHPVEQRGPCHRP
jgi:hypothetical protein